jgi:hypothetical protein
MSITTVKGSSLNINISQRGDYFYANITSLVEIVYAA